MPLSHTDYCLSLNQMGVQEQISEAKQVLKNPSGASSGPLGLDSSDFFGAFLGIYREKGLYEIHSCSCLTFLAGLDWVLLSKIYKPFPGSLYSHLWRKPILTTAFTVTAFS